MDESVRVCALCRGRTITLCVRHMTIYTVNGNCLSILLPQEWVYAHANMLFSLVFIWFVH